MRNEVDEAEESSEFEEEVRESWRKGEEFY
jgi:hypothetical protein